MKHIVISVENLTKTYRLGQIGTGTFTNDLKLWWAKMRGRPNPLLRIGEKDYGNRDGEELWALRDVSFAVQEGEVLGIIGRNGAGKSTLLKILSRVTAPTSGKIKVKGRVASLLEVGTGFHPELTGRENIYLNGAILGMKRKEINRKFDEIIDFAEIEKFIDTPVKRYSSGMYVRLAFAVAAHLEPEILVVDEVLAVGDASFQKKCLGKMGNVAKEGRTVLFVSHNMAAIRSLCTSGILLDQGCLSVADEVGSTIYKYQKMTEQKSQSSHFDQNQEVVFGNVKLAQSESEFLKAGNDFIIECDVTTQGTMSGFVFYCIIQNGEGDVIVHATANHHQLNQLLQNGFFTLSAHFPALWLKPGVYNAHFKIIPNMIAKGHVRYLSDSIMLDVIADVPSEMLLGDLTPEIDWALVKQNPS